MLSGFSLAAGSTGKAIAGAIRAWQLSLERGRGRRRQRRRTHPGTARL